MIIETAFVIGASIAALVAGAAAAKGLFNRGFIGTSLTQIALGGAFGYALASVASVSVFGAVAVPGLVFLFKVALLVYFYRLSKSALDGSLGQETMWVAEMVKEDDEEFKRALNHLTDTDRREIRIIAESKDELREEVIERAEQNS